MHENQEEDKKSKSQVKREMQALRDLGKKLIELPVAALDKLAISNTLYDAVMHAHGLKREALRRQIQHIGKLLRDEDDTGIREKLDRVSQPQRDQVRAFHQVEQWRDRLVAGDDDLINEIVERFMQADRQHLRQLVRNARREKERDVSPKAARSLFRYLAELQQGS
jgi:ribosome-associated protein